MDASESERSELVSEAKLTGKANLDELVWHAGVYLADLEVGDAWDKAASLILFLTRNRETRPRLLRLMREQDEE